MAKINIEVSNHPWRCIDEDGTRCKWIRVSRFGTAWSCKIFCDQADKGAWDTLNEREGCLERHPECIKAGASDG